MVDRSRPVGEHRRVVHRRGRHERADADPLGDGGDGRQHRPALVGVTHLHLLGAGVGHVMVGEPEAEPPVGVGGAGQIEHLGGGAGGVGPDGELHEADRSLRRVDDLWEEHAGWWIDGFTDGADPEYVEQILPLAEAELAGYERVLDVGCGDGQISRLLAAAGAMVAGVDPTWNQVRVAAERGGGPVYARAGATPLPFADSTFDAAVACLVFEHIDDADGAIAEVARVLRPGGRFAFFLNHPLLQSPGSGWIDDHLIDPPEQYWRIGPYLVENESIEQVELGVWIRFIHRPLSRYVNTLVDHGLVLERMLEPSPPAGFLERAPEYADAATVPRLLYLRLRRVDDL